MSDDTIIISDKELMGGTPVFAGTRVPVQSFIDWMMRGYTLEVFLDNFPTVSREQIEQFLNQAGEKLTIKVEDVKEDWDSFMTRMYGALADDPIDVGREL